MLRPMICIVAAVSALALALPAAAGPLDCPSRPQSAAWTTREVDAPGLVAAFMAPESPGPHPAILVLGGSEGGSEAVRRLAAPFAAEGFAVLALSYFRADGLPATLEDLPLEYFDKALDWLAANPAVDPRRIGVYGVSKGAEAALLLGSRSDRLRAVAAAMPTHVVWPGLGARGASSRSSWSSGGAPLAFLPYDTSRPFDPADWMGSVFGYYDRALVHDGAAPAAHIPVERTRAPVLLISGEDDRLWPSTRMSERVMARLRANDFAFAYHHLSYPDAGHAVGMPPAFGASEQGPDEAVGGTVAGNAAARADMWPKLLCFFDTAFDTGED